MQTGDKRQYIKNILILLLLVIFCSLSSYIYLKENKSIEYTLPTTNGIKTIEVAKGDIFEQDIKIHGSIDALSLFIANGGGNRVTINTGSIEFILQQGTVEESTILDINGIEDWTYVEIPINLSHFTTGMATLTIKGINTQIGSSIYLVYQVEDIYELPPLKYNGESLSGALFLKYETQNFGISFRNFVLFFSLSILLCLVFGKIYFLK